MASLGERWDYQLIGQHLRGHARVVYLGDSSVFTSSRSDRDRRTMVEYTAEILGEPVTDASHAAHNPMVYRAMAAALARFPGDTRLLVVPINLRSFSEPWLSHPGFLFTRRQAFFGWLGGHGSLSDTVTAWREDEEQLMVAWRDQIVHDDQYRLGRIGDILEQINNVPPPEQRTEALRRKLTGLRFAYNYGGQITRDHRMFRYIDEMMSALDGSGIQVLFYLTPLNYGDIQQYAGLRLTKRVVAGAATVRDYFKRRGWPLIDLSGLAPPHQFLDRYFASEHLLEASRRQVAAQVAAGIRQQLPAKEPLLKSLD